MRLKTVVVKSYHDHGGMTTKTHTSVFTPGSVHRGRATNDDKLETVCVVPSCLILRVSRTLRLLKVMRAISRKRSRQKPTLRGAH
jgi:hypothetical protein